MAAEAEGMEVVERAVVVEDLEAMMVAADRAVAMEVV